MRHKKQIRLKGNSFKSKSMGNTTKFGDKAKTRKYIKNFWKIVFAGLFGIFIMFLGIAMGWFGFMPSFSELEDPQTYFASEIYSHDNELIGTYFIENRSKSHYSEISPDLVNALIATEDVRFYKHSGIDLKALLRVLYGTIMGKNKGGGSTITQQLAKTCSHENIINHLFSLLSENSKNGLLLSS